MGRGKLHRAPHPHWEARTDLANAGAAPLRAAPAPRSGEAPGDVPAFLQQAPEIAVVLGGGAPRGIPAPPTLRRAEAAADLARARPRMALILSGDRGGADVTPGPSEAAVMAEAIAAAGIARERLFLEDESRDTLGNAVLVAARYLRHIDPQPLTVLTSPFHLERSLFVFRFALGPAWSVTGLASATAAGDDERARSEPAYLAETQAALERIAPGDLRRLARVLRERWPYNRMIERLRLVSEG